MTVFDQLLSNLTSPAVLAFFLGLGAAIIRSDLRVPPQVHEVISQYLLLAIGIKEGLPFMQHPFLSLFGPLS